MDKKKYYSDKNKAEFIYKILLLGDTSVGKTCFLLRYCDDIYNESHIATIGLDYRVKPVELNKRKIKLQIWDTAGQDRFRSITQSYYKGSHGILLIYDVENESSFQNIKQWVIQIREYSPKEVILVLVANKIDTTNRQVDQKEGEDFAKERNLIYIEASAKEGINVNEAFELLYKSIYEGGLGREVKDKTSIKIDEKHDNVSSSSTSKCCK